LLSEQIAGRLEDRQVKYGGLGRIAHAQWMVNKLRVEPNLSKLLACDGVRQLSEAIAGFHPAVVQLGLVVHEEGGGVEVGSID